MATLDKFYGVRIGMSCYDKILDYSCIISLICGLVVIIFGVFSFALGIAAVCTKSSAGFIGYGMWCGIMFVASGMVYLYTCRTGTACQVTVVMTFALLSAFCAIIQFSLGILGASVDSNRKNFFIDTTNQYVYDIFGPRNAARTSYCDGFEGYNFAGSWAPINILLLITGFIEFASNMTVAISTVISLCCGNREVVTYQVNPAFSQIDGQSGSYRPPMYKVFYEP